MSPLTAREKRISYALGLLGTACKDTPEQTEAFLTEWLAADGEAAILGIESARAVVDVLTRALLNLPP